MYMLRGKRQIQKDVTPSLNRPVDSCRLNLKDDTKSMDPDQFHSVDCWPVYWFLRYIKFGFIGTERLIHPTVQSSHKMPTQEICEQCVSLNNDLSSIPYPPPPPPKKKVLGNRENIWSVGSRARLGHPLRNVKPLRRIRNTVIYYFIFVSVVSLSLVGNDISKVTNCYLLNLFAVGNLVKGLLSSPGEILSITTEDIFLTNHLF